MSSPHEVLSEEELIQSGQIIEDVPGTGTVVLYCLPTLQYTVQPSEFSCCRYFSFLAMTTRSPVRVILLLDLDCFYAQCERVRLGLDAETCSLALLQVKARQANCRRQVFATFQHFTHLNYYFSHSVELCLGSHLSSAEVWNQEG